MLFFDDGGGRMPFGTASPESEARWGALLVGVNLLVFLLLGLGMGGAVGGAALEAQAELRKAREEEARLNAELAQMRAKHEEDTEVIGLRIKALQVKPEPPTPT